MIPVMADVSLHECYPSLRFWHIHDTTACLMDGRPRSTPLATGAGRQAGYRSPLSWLCCAQVLAFFLPGSNFAKLMKRFSEQRVNTDNSSDSDDDDAHSPAWPKSARSPRKQPAAPSPQELVEIGIDIEQPSQHRVATAVPRLSEGIAPDDAEDTGIALQRMKSAPEKVVQERSLTAPRASDLKQQVPSLSDVVGRKGDGVERKEEFPLPPATTQDAHVALRRPRGGSADFDSKKSPQGLRPRAGSDGELAASSPMHVERHGSADDLFGDNVHV